MGKINIFIFGILTICLSSCIASLKDKNKFKNTNHCFKNSINVDSLNNLGYYRFHIYNAFSKDDSSKTYDIVFYKNGICLNSYFENKENNEEENERWGRWGTYFVENDTIKTLTFNPPGSLQFISTEYWFKIRNDKTLENICAGIHCASETSIKNYQKIKENESVIGKFVKLDTLPDFNNSWIIKRKWFWCNKQDWKEWKKNH
jgi:hypothetical protein